MFEGQDLSSVPVEKLVQRGIAHVPEGRGVVAELTVDENLRLGGLWRKDRADDARALDEVYQLFEPLARRRGFPGHQLSGGERQMLAVGRALMARPRLLLLDEPSLGLAPKVTAQIMALLKHLRDDSGLTVLLVEQNVRSALVRRRPRRGDVAGPGRGLAQGRRAARGPGSAPRVPRLLILRRHCSAARSPWKDGTAWTSSSFSPPTAWRRARCTPPSRCRWC